MPLFTGQAKNMAASYFCKNYLTVFQQKWDLCIYMYLLCGKPDNFLRIFLQIRNPLKISLLITKLSISQTYIC
jgi:hypothetical protein